MILSKDENLSGLGQEGLEKPWIAHWVGIGER